MKIEKKITLWKTRTLNKKSNIETFWTPISVFCGNFERINDSSP
jgi:hypothetical protein